MTSPDPHEQLVRLASDYQSAYQDAWRWFLQQGPSASNILLAGLDDSSLGSECHWRILLILRELALPSTLPAILGAFHTALASDNPIVLPGAMEALAAFPTDEAIAALASIRDRGSIDSIQHSAALLGNIADDRAVRSLASYLNHPHASVRRAAIKALQKANTPLAHKEIEQHRKIEEDPAVLGLMGSV